ncbi:MAG: hypothetical protein KGL00_10115 [Gammaproteobacteria bacterium]|nr:hypothetical protein [Gammaproteobacteria bacterium]MDE1886855.1 hypothetical protein [Gammaproteobacteria bacterium]MDE2023397.1 hypothetical protein [Gammaproteobacteria bacterium]MDE2138885.1 hypothetical protein [Gammaproteobacteria bacterium]MDE2274537.1 hypothetical protein [Gammaproteobacteria bacterium]
MGRRNQSAVSTLVERTTYTLIPVPLKNRDAKAVRTAFVRELKTLLQQMKLSLTHDRGKVMTEHKLFTRDAKMQVYFSARMDWVHRNSGHWGGQP